MSSILDNNLMERRHLNKSLNIFFTIIIVHNFERKPDYRYTIEKRKLLYACRQHLHATVLNVHAGRRKKIHLGSLMVVPVKDACLYDAHASLRGATTVLKS